MKKFTRNVIAAVAGLASAAVITSALAADISGAGATFPYPIYAKWAAAYKGVSGVGLNYQSIGSGGGIAQIKAKTVTFGASDMPLASGAAQCRRHGAVSDRDRRRSRGLQRRRHIGRSAGSGRTDACQHLSRPHCALERSGHQEAQSIAQSAGPGDRGRAPFRRIGHDLRVRDVSLARQQRLEEQCRRSDVGRLADRHRRKRQ